MTQYAVGNGFRVNEVLQNLEALAIYKREAEETARRAAAAGDFHAAAALAAAYSPLNADTARTYLAQVVKPEPVAALDLYLRLSLCFGTSRKTAWMSIE